MLAIGGIDAGASAPLAQWPSREPSIDLESRLLVSAAQDCGTSRCMGIRPHVDTGGAGRAQVVLIQVGFAKYGDYITAWYRRWRPERFPVGKRHPSRYEVRPVEVEEAVGASQMRLNRSSADQF